MKIEDFKKGDLVLIPRQVSQWSSNPKGNYPEWICPTGLHFPVTGEIQEIVWHKDADYWAANIGGFGFDLSALIADDNIQLEKRWAPKKKEEPQDEPFQDFLIYHHQGLVCGTVVGKYEGENLKLSVSVCSPKEQFSRRKGRNEAIRRYNVCPQVVLRFQKEFEKSWPSKGKFFKAAAEQLLEGYNETPYRLISTK